MKKKRGGDWSPMKVMNKRVKKLNDWLKDSQFSLCYDIINPSIILFALRLKDERHFHIKKEFVSMNDNRYGVCSIQGFCADSIHVIIRHAKFGEKIKTRWVQINSL